MSYRREAVGWEGHGHGRVIRVKFIGELNVWNFTLNLA